MNIKKLLISAPTNQQEAQEYIQTCVEEIGMGFHPDDSMGDLTYFTTGLPVFKKREYLKIDHNIKQCFEFLGERVYIIGMRAMGARRKY